jgi:hypothetical protein
LEHDIRGKNNRSRGAEEERTNPYNNYASSPQEFWRGRPKRERNAKNRIRSDTVIVLP